MNTYANAIYTGFVHQCKLHQVQTWTDMQPSWGRSHSRQVLLHFTTGQWEVGEQAIVYLPLADSYPGMDASRQKSYWFNLHQQAYPDSFRSNSLQDWAKLFHVKG